MFKLSGWDILPMLPLSLIAAVFLIRTEKKCDTCPNKKNAHNEVFNDSSNKTITPKAIPFDMAQVKQVRAIDSLKIK